MRLIVDESLVAGFIPINTQQQRHSLPFKPGVLEWKVYNTDDITFFFVLMFAKRVADNVQAANHYHTRAWQMLIHGKECFILLILILGM